VQPNDYTTVNEAVRHGYQLFIGPMTYTAPMDDPRFEKLSGYIAEVNRIRQIARGAVYDGVYLDSEQYNVSADSHHIKSMGFIDPKTGRRACVVTNTDSKSNAAAVSFSGDSRMTIYIPFEPECTLSPGEKFDIPAEMVAIVLENG